MGKRILFYGRFTGGGTERITYNLASALADDGNEVTVVNTADSPPRFALSATVRYVYLRDAIGRCRRSLPSLIMAVRRMIRRGRFDVVVSIEALTGIVLIPATLGLRCRTVAWDHANYFQTQGSRWMHAVRRLWMHVADAYVVLTRRDLRNFEAHERPRCRLVQIYNPVAVQGVEPYSAQRKRIISAGHLVPIKRFHLIPEIFAPVAARHPGWTWHIFGEGPERKAIEDEIARHGLVGRVVLEGASGCIDAEYSRSAIYVLTSRQEGLPTVLIEAQMHGLPAVSFDIETGPDEIIADGVNGYLVPDGDTAAMAALIERLIADVELRLRFSSQAQRDCGRFAVDRALGRWRELFDQI